MFRGLFIDAYRVFKSCPPPTEGQLPLGVLTFPDEHLAYCNAATTSSEKLRRELLFGNTIPPVFFDTLLTLKSMAISDCDECLSARWILYTTYTEAYPEHPMSELATPRCFADTLLALSMEGGVEGQQCIHLALSKAFLRTPLISCQFLH